MNNQRKEKSDELEARKTNYAQRASRKSTEQITMYGINVLKYKDGMKKTYVSTDFDILEHNWLWFWCQHVVQSQTLTYTVYLLYICQYILGKSEIKHVLSHMISFQVYMCSCTKALDTLSNMMQHTHTCTGNADRPFMCPTCNQTFAAKDSKRQHQKKFKH